MYVHEKQNLEYNWQTYIYNNFIDFVTIVFKKHSFFHSILLEFRILQWAVFSYLVADVISISIKVFWDDVDCRIPNLIRTNFPFAYSTRYSQAVLM